jgi:hypothetical protein
MLCLPSLPSSCREENSPGGIKPAGYAWACSAAAFDLRRPIQYPRKVRAAATAMGPITAPAIQSLLEECAGAAVCEGVGVGDDVGVRLLEVLEVVVEAVMPGCILA